MGYKLGYLKYMITLKPLKQLLHFIVKYQMYVGIEILIGASLFTVGFSCLFNANAVQKHLLSLLTMTVIGFLFLTHGLYLKLEKKLG